MPKKKLKQDAKAFAEDLEGNEEDMGECAAMIVTCEQWNISEEEGYDLLIAASEEK